MAIFNSLGSNYDLNYVLKSLFVRSSKKDHKKLKNLLSEKYGGRAILLYKGREAITLALRVSNLPEDSLVAINGFTCVAVFNAIRTAGYEPKCLDLEEKGNLNFTANTLEKELNKDKKIKAVIVQNTFGYPCEIDKIEQICKRNNLILIEDLAHSVGTKYQDGREAGTVGDFVIMSFSQDKIIDAVSGGALVIRNKKYLKNNVSEAPLESNPITKQLKDRFYPRLTFRIRHMYSLGVGKPYHFLVKKLGLLSNIMDESFYKIYSLPNWNAAMALYSFKNIDKQLAHRKNIVKIYSENLSKKILFDEVLENVNLSSNLRFPIQIDNRISLVNFLKSKNIYLSDIWYHDVAPECPNAVTVSKTILNLPTHINVSEKDAIRISELINTWIKSR